MCNYQHGFVFAKFLMLYHFFCALIHGACRLIQKYFRFVKGSAKLIFVFVRQIGQYPVLLFLGHILWCDPTNHQLPQLYRFRVFIIIFIEAHLNIFLITQPAVLQHNLNIFSDISRVNLSHVYLSIKIDQKSALSYRR